MFKITVRVEVDVKITGLTALDLRRRLGLPDGSLVVMPNDQSAQFPKLVACVTVSETFAREHFRPNDREITRSVGVDSLSLGDAVLVDTSFQDDVLTIRADLPADRVIALWLAAE